MFALLLSAVLTLTVHVEQTVEHMTLVLVDRNGMKRVSWSGFDWSVDGLLADIHTLMDED